MDLEQLLELYSAFFGEKLNFFALRIRGESDNEISKMIREAIAKKQTILIPDNMIY